MATTKKGKKGGKKSAKAKKKSTRKTSTKSAKKGGRKRMTPLSATKDTEGQGKNKEEQKNANRQADTMKKLEDLQKETAPPTRESSAKRSQSGTGNNPVPPEDRPMSQVGTQSTAATDAAAGALATAKTHLARQEESEKALHSDPRYERDQEIFKLGQEGKLGFVPPSEAEQAALEEKHGSKLPRNAKEQAADDKRRLAEAKKHGAGTSTESDNTGGTTTGTQE